MNVIEPRADEQWLGDLRVVQVRRRDYDSGKVTEAVVVDMNGKRQIATKFGEPLPLSAIPQVKLERQRYECAECSQPDCGWQGECDGESCPACGGHVVEVPAGVGEGRNG